MVNWQVTATTIYCEAIGEEATLMVFKDGSVKCTAYNKYRGASPETLSAMKERRAVAKRRPACQGMPCDRATEYRDRLFNEDKSGS